MLKGMDKIIILLQLGCIATTIESCHEQNKFGRSCRLSCNCKNELKNDCEDGWYGSTCQKRNLALNKFTNQTSVGHRGYSKNAVDGMKGKDFYNKTFLCTHGQGDENYPWWYVDLNKTVAVKTMKIYNRKGKHRDRMNGIQIRVGNSTEFKKDIAKMTENTICYQHNGTYLIDEEAVVCPSVIYGRFVIVWRNKTNVRMNICELEVYQCADFTFGRDCASECKCFSETEVCDRSTGACPLSGCDRGYTGTNCSKVCMDKWFGINCEKHCHCRNDEVCNKVTGFCSSGCATHWTGNDCQQVKRFRDIIWPTVGVTFAIVIGPLLLIFVLAVILMKRRNLMNSPVCLCCESHYTKAITPKNQIELIYELGDTSQPR